MKIHLLAALCGVLSSLHAEVLIDFGMTTQTTPATGGKSWNNIAVTGISSGVTTLTVNSVTGQASASLLDAATGAGSGITLTIAYSAATVFGTQGGTAGSGGNYSGTVAPDAATLFPASATRDSIYVNNSNGGAAEVLTLSFSGLAADRSYNIVAFGGRDATNSASGSWVLTTGTATTARYQDSAGNHTDNSGQNVSTAGANAGLSPQWLGVSPNASGNLVLTLTSATSSALDLNTLSIATASAPPAGKEVDVYLLAGQSNMQGLGKLAELTPQQLAPAPEVFYWTGNNFVPLVPGTTVTAAAGEFGPEIAFATEIAKRGRPAYIIKYYNSGKPLDAGWNDQTWLGDPPAPGRVNFYPGTSASDPNQGTLYKNAMLPKFQAGIAAIAAKGDTPLVRGLIWMQGEQDSKNAISAGRYAENLKRLRDRLAADLSLPALPVVFGQVLPFSPAEARFTHRMEIRAEMALADMDSGSPKAIPLCRMVSTDAYPVYPPPDAVHYTTPGQITLGTAFATGLEALFNQPPKPIHIAFHNSAATRDAMASATAPTTQGSRVNTSLETWNNIQNSAAHTFSNLPLLSADGLSRGALLAGSTGFTGATSNGWASRNKDSVMMDGFYAFAGSESLTVSGLPSALAAEYHVIIYGDANSNRTMNYAIAGVTKTIQDNGVFGGTFTDGVNEVVFSGLSGTSFTLTGNSATPRSAVNGISIIPGSPPGPPVIGSFSASDHYVAPGEPVTLSWSVTGADTVSISPGIGSVAATGSVQVTPTAFATYTLTAVNGDGEASATVSVHTGPARPNIVFFIVDDMGWQDTSVPFHYDSGGNPVVTGFNQRYRTPNMDALAASGRKFTNAYAYAICSPSRISLMTGQSPARHHVTNWTLRPDLDQSDVSATLKSPLDWNVNGLAPANDTTSQRVWRTDATLPRLLQNSGYRTIHVGKAHFGADTLPGEDPLAQGFDVNIAGHAAGGPSSFLGTANYAGSNTIFNVPGLEQYHGTNTFLTEALTLEANKAVTKAVADGAPFFLHMSHYAVHVPLAEDLRFSANYPTLDATERRYATMVEGMDKSLGDIRNKLQQLGVAENTIIIFYSDNGGLSGSARGTTPAGTGANTHNKPLRAGKGSAYEGGTRVPAIVGWAHAAAGNVHQTRIPIPANTHGDKPFIIQDLFPTILDIAGVAKPGGIDGVSVIDYFTNTPGFEREPSFLFHVPHTWTAGYIGQNEGYEVHSSLREGDWKIIHYYENSRWELYNLAQDLGEANNLAATQPSRVFQLGRKMIRALDDQNAQFAVNRTTNLPKRPLLPINASVDSDGDGLSDNAEDPNRNGLVDPGETDSDNADTDGDGTPDGAEARIGTDPLDPSSAFHSRIGAGGAGWVLTWPSLPGASFSIRSSGDLSDWSTIEASGIPATPEPARQTSYAITPHAATTRFFKVSLDQR